MTIILYKDLTITLIKKKSLKHTYILVEDGRVTVKTPSSSKQFINKLLDDRESWIYKQLSKHKANPPLQINLEDEVALFGFVYSVDLDEVKMLRVMLEKLKKPTRENVLKAYDRFYKQLAKEYLTPRLEEFAKLMNLHYSEIKFRKMHSRWGSCSSKKVITLSTELLKLKKEQIDYVLVHELAHLVEMNHSKRFHNLVQKYLPNAKELKKDIKLRQKMVY